MLVSLSEQATLLKIIFWKYIMTIQTSSKVCSFFNSFIHFSISDVANNALHAFGNFKASGILLLVMTCFVLYLARKSNVQGLIFYFSSRQIDSFARFRDFWASPQSRLPLTCQKMCNNLSWAKRLYLTSGSASTSKGGLVKTELHCECTHFKRHSERFSKRIKFM